MRFHIRSEAELRDIAEEYRVMAAHMHSPEARASWLRMATTIEAQIDIDRRLTPDCRG